MGPSSPSASDGAVDGCVARLDRLVGGADQPLNTPVAAKLLLAEGAGLDLFLGGAGPDQRVPHGLDAAVVQILVARVGGSRVHRPVNPDLERRVLLQVDGDVGHLRRFRSLHFRVVGIEPEIPVGRPAIDDTGAALRASGSRGTPWTCRPGPAGRACRTRLRVARVSPLSRGTL